MSAQKISSVKSGFREPQYVSQFCHSFTSNLTFKSVSYNTNLKVLMLYIYIYIFQIQIFYFPSLANQPFITLILELISNSKYIHFVQSISRIEASYFFHHSINSVTICDPIVQRLRFTPLSQWSKRNLSVIFTVRQKRNLLVGEDRRARKKGGKSVRWGERKRGEGGTRKRERRWRHGTTSRVLFPHDIFPCLVTPSRLDETRPSHVTLNWSIICQSSCPNRRRSQSKEASRLSAPDNRGFFLSEI